MSNSADSTRQTDGYGGDHQPELGPPRADSATDGSDGVDRRAFLVRNHVRKRLDLYLQSRLKGISRSRVQKLIASGGVTVNRQPPKSSTTIRRGDRIDVILPPPAIRIIEPEAIRLDILYEDESLIVINKQADLIVHPARSHLRGTLVNALAHHFKQQLERSGGTWTHWNTRGFKQTGHLKTQTLGEQEPEPLRPGIVHRLDKHTTGVMVVAKTEEAHWMIARQFEDRQVIKAYLAVVHGGPDEAGGVIEQPIGKHPTFREAYAVRHDSSGKQSVTLYRVLRRYQGYTLLELELKTGRTHQIRVHLSYLGWPIVGDFCYGGEPVGGRELDEPPVAAGHRRYVTFARDRDEGRRIEAATAQRVDVIMARPALHAALLKFTHPVTGHLMEFVAPMQEPMKTLLAQLDQRRIDGPIATAGFWVDLDRVMTAG